MRPLELRAEVHIPAPPERVFPWIAEPERARQWQQDVLGWELLHEEPGLVGTTFRETVGDGRGQTELLGRVTGLVPGRELRFHLEGRYNTVEVCFSVEPTAEGCRVRQELSLRFKGLLGPLSQLRRRAWLRRLQAQAERELEALRACCLDELSPG